jgi:hypothetical protein
MIFLTKFIFVELDIQSGTEDAHLYSGGLQVLHDWSSLFNIDTVDFSTQSPC